MKYLVLILTLLYSFTAKAENFNYSIELEAVTVDNIKGLHSFAFGQDNTKWLIIGGRTDGLHPRQPFASFPAANNNMELFVIDPANNYFKARSLSSLPQNLIEQLQSTNMNFKQVEDTLYIIGGYAYSTTAQDHITFSSLITVNISGLINAIMKDEPITEYFKQISDPIFAVTGGQLAFVNGTFYLVGGHRFDGRYHPMDSRTYTQVYTNQIRKFKIDNSGENLIFSEYSAITDPIHLRRRDYNLVPQVFPNGELGFTIFSGVFQLNVDLPFLYPVDITESSYNPIPEFNQFLSHYHSPKAGLYDSKSKTMHSIFFGGLSQYYYNGGELIRDDLVPFVSTISRVTRFSDGRLQEYQLPTVMPGLRGASAEFIPNYNLPHYENGVFDLENIEQDTVLLGYIYGGILSPSRNPFSANQTNITSADNVIYAVKLINAESTGVIEMPNENPYSIDVYPNPADNLLNINFTTEIATDVVYYISTLDGKIIYNGKLEQTILGENLIEILLDENLSTQTLFINMVFDGKYYVTQKFLKE